MSRKILLFICIFLCAFSFTVAHAQVNGNDYGLITEASSSDQQSDVQKVKVAIKSGKFNNAILDVSFKFPSDAIKRPLQKGDVVLVRVNVGADNRLQGADIVDFYRVPNIFWAPLLFLLILLITVVVKYRRKTYLLLSFVASFGVSIPAILYTNVNGVLILTICFSIQFALLLYFLYKKVSIAFVGLVIPMILSIGATLLAYITLQLTQIQLSYLSVITTFYNNTTSNFYESYYVAVVIAAVGGAIYISYQQILETVKIRISHEDITKRELTFRSFKGAIRNFDSIIFPSIIFILAFGFSILLFLQKNIGIEAALNNDLWVSISVLSCVTFIAWILSVPICALICGMVLGHIEQHKVVTDKTIGILD